MKIFRRFEQSSFFSKACVATMGNFDGVHIGQQTILKQVMTLAHEKKLPGVLISFEPMPAEFFLEDNAPARLTRLREKVHCLQSQHLDALAILPFDTALSQLSAEDFIENILIARFHVKYLFVGADFRFGNDRLGNIALLKQYAQHFTVITQEDITVQQERVSSSLIRDALLKGDLMFAEKCLGRPYSMMGRVVQGHQRGRTIGFPTANILLQRKKSPILGVYAVKIHGLGEQVLTGVANVGNRPTVDNSLRTVLETHIFDYHETIYGRTIEIEFIKKIRDEKRFDSFELLKQQILHDADEARVFFLNNP